MHKSVFAFLLYCLLVSSHSVFAEQSLTVVKKRPKAPAFRLNDMDGISHPLSDYLGQPVIINFWATWCPPCREELPSMNRAWNMIKNEGIAMLAINVGEDEETIFSFMGDYPIDFTILLDQNAEIAEKWPMKGLPTTYVVDPEGFIVFRAVGGRDWDNPKLLDRVRGLKKQPAKKP
ncbi:MAG TPA: TlpA family protein disulfide reductase [Gammaproteobacteria bacterium]|nr:TlpA family protein disulfide reductase [Gammaproteobacteria bacterium]